MRKKTATLSISVIIMLTYMILSFLFLKEKDIIFWTGLLFLFLAIILNYSLVLLADKRHSEVFPIEISSVFVSSLYALSVLIINILFGHIFKLRIKTFLSIHILWLAIILIIMSLIFLAKKMVTKQNIDSNNSIGELQNIIYELEKVKSKLSSLSENHDINSMYLIDSLLEKLKYSDFSANVNTLDIDNQIKDRIFALSITVSNLIENQPADLEHFTTLVKETLQLVDNRNFKIRNYGNKI